MKVLVVSTISNTINKFLIPHIRLLYNEKAKVDVACSLDQELNHELLEITENRLLIPFNRSVFSYDNIRAYTMLKKIINENDYDIIHCHTPVASFITRLANRNNLSTKMIYTAHGFHFFKNASLLNWLLYFPLEFIGSKFTDKLIVLNKEDLKLAQKYFQSKRCKIFFVNGVGVDFENTQNNKQLKEMDFKHKSIKLFYAAELNNNKNQSFLIDVVKELISRGLDIELILAGKGKLMNKLKRDTEALKIDSNVKFLGYINNVNEMLNEIDIVVCSSLREGLPVNVIEAQAKGIPVVATDIRGHNDIIINSVTGYLVGIGDLHGFSNSIEKLIEKEVYLEMSNNAKEIAKKFSLKEILKDMKKIYFSE